jgi:hypothetical protein
MINIEGKHAKAFRRSPKSFFFIFFLRKIAFSGYVQLFAKGLQKKTH